MTTDFLDRLEADLRVAAENRGTPRRRRPRPGPALKLVVVAAVIALIVVGIARLAARESTVHPARPTPTPDTAFFLDSDRVIVATSGYLAVLDLLAARLDAKWPSDSGFGGSPHGASASLGTVLLYRDGLKKLAEVVARDAGIDRLRVLTPELEEQLAFAVPDDAPLVAVFGRDYQDRVLADCQPAGTVTGGELKLCQEAGVSGFLVDGERLRVNRILREGNWTWAAASPDGRTILAEWTGACHMPTAALIPVNGDDRPVLLTNTDASRAMGWTTDGRAIVFHYVGQQCNPSGAAGLVLYDNKGDSEVVGKAAPQGLPRSIEPRDTEEITGAP